MLALVHDRDEPRLLGSLVDFVARGNVLAHLAAWSDELDSLRPIVELGLRVWGSTDPRATLPRVDPAERVDHALRGLLAASPLAALCAARKPPLSLSDQGWVDTMRAWLLAVAVEYAETGNSSDRHLGRVAGHLRRSCDDARQEQRLGWFLSIRSPSASVLELGEAISERCRANLASNHTAKLRDPFPTMASDVFAVAEWRELPGAIKGAAPISPQYPLRPLVVPEIVGQLLDGAEAAGGVELPLADDEDSVHAVVVPEPEDSTYEEGSLAARGVLLQSVEDRQLLPFSWRRPTRTESDALRRMIDGLLSSSEPQEQMLGALAAIAFISARSMETVCLIPLQSKIAEDWSLNLRAGELHRQPARRGNRWKLAAASSSWARPLADAWRIRLDPSVLRPLHKAARMRGRASTIGALWQRVADVTLEKAFNDTCRKNPGLARVTSGLMSRAGEPALFEVTRDASFVRLVTSTARSGLPGACAYPSWTAESTQNAWKCAIGPKWIEGSSFGRVGENALGSELDPIDVLLLQAISSLLVRIETVCVDPAMWVERHNCLTAYVVLALLAATGARPVDSPFESPTLFDWEKGFAFIDDKATASRESGRAVPIVRAAMDLVVEVYLPHLRQLGDALMGALPTFATELACLSHRKRSRKLPLFFFLKAVPTFDWITVSEASLDAVAPFDWPLPWNLMRHRLATRLRSLRVDPEIIDGFFDHAEGGTESYGDVSMRTWLSDVQASRPALEQTFEALGFRRPTIDLHLPPIFVTVPSDQTIFSETIVFGAEARRRRRSADHERARRSAGAAIEAALGRRTLAELSAEELDVLGKSMLLTDKGLPHPYASLRYEVFDKRLRDFSRSSGKRPQLRRRYVVAKPTTSVFSPAVIGAIAVARNAHQSAAALAVWADRKRLGPNVLALLAAFDMCACSRVTARYVLDAVMQRKDVTPIVIGRTAWLEYRADLETYPDQPCARYPLTARAARWLDQALSATRGGPPASRIPEVLSSLRERLVDDQVGDAASASDFMSRLSAKMAQANLLELPSAVAAYLDGRIESWGLPPHDWIRVLTGRARREPGADHETMGKNQGAPASSKQRQAPPRTQHRTRLGLDDRQRFATALLDATREALGDWDRQNPRGTADTLARRDFRRRIARLVRDAEPGTPQSIVALAAWVGDLLRKRPQTPMFLQASSIMRYLAALAPRFMQHGHEVDLAELDGDELTELYAAILDPEIVDGRPTFDHSYVEARLREFHRFAQRELGLEAPDWAEIGVDGPAASGAPGIILEPEYLYALGVLAPAPTQSTREQLCTAMLLLLGFRFGLRGREAHGLLRADWADHFGALVVLVRANRVRSLKSAAAQRQVPLIARLSDLEAAIMERWLATWDVISAGDSKIPLFAGDGQGTLLSLRVLRHRVVLAMRAACRRTHTTLHHARHAFANEVFMALAPERMVIRSPHWLDRDHVRRTLLGGTSDTRRSLWALARVIGHAHPRTTLKSYVHVLAESARCLVVDQDDALTWSMEEWRLSAGPNLDRWPVDAEYLIATSQSSAQSINARPATLQDLVTAAHLFARGRTVEAAAFAMGTNEVAVRRLSDWLTLTNARLGHLGRPVKSTSAGVSKVSKAATKTRAKQRGRPNLLRNVLTHRWEALKTIAQGVSVEPLEAHWTINADTAACQVGPTHQLLMWEPTHFVWIQRFVQAFGLADDVAIYETDELDGRVAQWADDAGFRARRKQRDHSGIRIFQIDGVVDGAPPQRVLNRCAAVRTSESARLRSNIELLLLWGCYAIAASSMTDGGTSIARSSAGDSIP